VGELQEYRLTMPHGGDARTCAMALCAAVTTVRHVCAPKAHPDFFFSALSPARTS
jgi:hypothetical protein